MKNKKQAQKQQTQTASKSQVASAAQEKSLFQKIWYFLWYEDSVLSWFASLLVAFVLIKFILYPGLGLLMGTQFPIVAVVSNSMEHEGSFNDWWALHEDFYLRNEISKETFQEYPFKNGFNKGDIMILIGSKPEKLERGDILVFWSQKPYPIIHRITTISVDEDTGERYFETKGDHNRDQVRQPPVLDETKILENQVVGKAVLRIPYLGYVKIWFVDLISNLAGSNA